MFEETDRSRLAWWGVAVVLSGVLVFVLFTFAGTFVLGLFLYYSARPVYERLRPRMRSPTLTAMAALLLLSLPVVLLFAYTTVLGIAELQSLGNLDLSEYEAFLAPYQSALRLYDTQFVALRSLLYESAY